MLKFALAVQHKEISEEKNVKRKKYTHPNESKQKRSNVSKSSQHAEEALENFVFGGEAEVIKNLGNEQKIIDVESASLKKTAWIDEDDEAIETSDCLHKKKLKQKDKYSEHLRDRFTSTIGTPKWAELNREIQSSDESDEEIVRTAGNLIRQTQNLTSGTIDLRKCTDINNEDKSINIITSVEFHPSSQVALVADVLGKVTIFQVDGKANSKIQSIQFRKFPLNCAHFTVDGEQIIVGSSKHSFFYYYDMMSGKIINVPWEKGLGHCNKRRMYVSPDGNFIVAAGKYGHIHLMSAKTKEWLGEMKMNGEVLSIAFSANGKFMYTHGEAGQVFIWDLNTRQCIHQFYDDGCVTGTSVALSPNDQFLATGSDSGVVNVYKNESLTYSSNLQPIKTFLNLTTEITSLKFNHSSEILAMASNLKSSSVKLAHFPSMTVYSNFPQNMKTTMKVTSLDFSLNSGFFTTATNKGTVELFRIKKFGNY